MATVPEGAVSAVQQQPVRAAKRAWNPAAVVRLEATALEEAVSAVQQQPAKRAWNPAVLQYLAMASERAVSAVVVVQQWQAKATGRAVSVVVVLQRLAMV